jgi:hypothetical protein
MSLQPQGLMPDIVLSAQDSDVIKTYVELGLGSGWWRNSPVMPGSGHLYAS